MSFFLSECFTPIPEKWLMQTQAEECVKMADLLPDSFELRGFEDGAQQGDVHFGWCWGPPRVCALQHALPKWLRSIPTG